MGYHVNIVPNVYNGVENVSSSVDHVFKRHKCIDVVVCDVSQFSIPVFASDYGNLRRFAVDVRDRLLRRVGGFIAGGIGVATDAVIIN